MMPDLFSRAPRAMRESHHYRRGIFLLPSLFTVGNLFCGYACIVYSMRGDLAIEQLWVAYDVGRAVNPMLIEAQIAGGVLQGVGGALLEEFIYDRSGQPLAASFADYLLPGLGDAPPKSERSAGSNGGRTTPFSRTIAVTSAAGVTSNAGLSARTPAGVTARPNGAATSSEPRSSIGISSPDAIDRSRVEEGAAT